MKEVLFIRSGTQVPRLRYTLDVLFHHIWEKEYTLCENAEAFRLYQGPKITYGISPLPDCSALYIPSSGFLESDTNNNAQPAVGWRENMPFLFAANDNSDIPFDIFSAFFYMLSRWEEYLPGPRDHYGRFCAKNSLAYRKGFLHRPIVQEWAAFLDQRLKNQFPGWKSSKPAYRFQPTFDVDQAWAYRFKSPCRTLGGTLKDAVKGDIRSLRYRREVLQGKREDPFFTFADIETWHRKTDSDPIFFFHLGDYGALDKNTSPNHPMWKELIRRLANAHQTGLHFSWKAGADINQLALEVERFTNITGKAPLISRQHYLRLSMPQTYRMLLAQGISQDYSMGFADVPGFRAGISLPFPWYDLLLEQKTKLMIMPFALMDVTLKQYLSLEPQEGLKIALALLTRVKATGGIFSTLWHNSSFSELGNWTPWREMYLHLKAAAE